MAVEEVAPAGETCFEAIVGNGAREINGFDLICTIGVFCRLTVFPAEASQGIFLFVDFEVFDFVGGRACVFA